MHEEGSSQIRTIAYKGGGGERLILAILVHPYYVDDPKLPQYFYLLMEKPLSCYFQVWCPYYQVARCNQKTPIPVSSW